MPKSLDTKIDRLSCQSYKVPTDKPEADGTIAWSSTTVVVVQAFAGGTCGTGWTYASDACRTLVTEELAPSVEGGDALDVSRHHEAMVRHCRNLGRDGVVSSAISAVDIALWDLKAQLLGISLGDLFGRCRDEVPIYGSGGFTTYDEATLKSQVNRWVNEQGITMIKMKIGESWGSDVARDIARAGTARRAAGDKTELMVDANGGYSRKQAVRVGHALEEDYGIVWFEEPVSSDDLDGLREVRDHLSCDIAAGEYGYDESYFARMIAAGAVDCLQADVTRCGGYTSWLRAAAIAGAHSMQISGHCGPNLHAHVAVAVPNLRHVEFFHDHERCDSILFEGCLDPADGVLVPAAGVPGHGMSLRKAGLDEWRIG